jgi:hypothetical protein
MQLPARPLLLAIVGVAVLCRGCGHVEKRAEPIQSLAQIPVPNPQLYVHVHDYEHWRNPFLVVSSDGIRVHCLATAFEKKVPVGALHQTLLSLPLSAWPYGRIVAVQAGGGPQNNTSRRFVEQNRVQVEAILKAAGVTIDYWP